jgi:hypothetical protein
MAPLTSAAHLRTPLKNILADEILFEKDFAPAVLPDELTKQLDPNTRAVNVAVMKDKCAGGTIRIGEFVDVILTTKISYDDPVKEELRTACVARACKVVMKRNTPWQIMAADPDDKPVHFTLQANPYRAALIEYAQSFGQISLQPVPTPAKSNGSFTDLSSPEYAVEDKRVEEITQGTRLIGTEDLVRIFKIPPPSPKPLPPQPVVIQHLTGVQQASPTVFYVNGNAPFNPMTGATASAVGSQPSQSNQTTQPASGVGYGAGRAPASAAASFQSPGGGTQSAGAGFQLPSATGQTNCPECEAKKKAEQELLRKLVNDQTPRPPQNGFSPPK